MSRIVVVSNRVPLPSGNITQAGGLAVALLGLMQAEGGLWFGWSGMVSDDAAPGPQETRHHGVSYVTCDLNGREHAGYYSGYANSVLWPSLHGLSHLMRFRREEFRTYQQVNQRFAGMLAPMLRCDDRIWIHDYHLMSLPAALRQRGVNGPTGFFLHIPFPGLEGAAAAPGLRHLIHDVLAADLLGFQTTNDRDNFAAAALAFTPAQRRNDENLDINGRNVRLGVFPAEIDGIRFAKLASDQYRTDATRRLLQSLQGQPLMLGVDRLDPTKGLPERLEAFGRTLRRYAAHHAVFLQIAAPSREEVGAYRKLRQELEAASGALNCDLGEPDWLPLRFIAKPQSRETVAGYMRAARVGVVTPLRDGMNLVAKEFIAAQDPASPGVLVLSRFAGAAAQLDAALLVNPHDVESMAEALQRALAMPLEERKDRWSSCWRAIAETSPEAWGRDFLAALQPAGQA